MRLLVTGGLGFIGSHFVRAALGSPAVDSVKVLDAMTYAANPARLSDVAGDFELIEGSISDSDLLDGLGGSVDAVVNFAAESHNDNSLKNPGVFFETNVNGLVTLATYCQKNRIRLHHVSTDEVFGDTSIDSTLKFNAASPLRPSSPYSSSKAAGDLLLGAWGRSFNLDYTISNCSNNFGADQHSEKLIPTLFRHLTAGEPAPIYGNGKNIRDWIHVSDHVAGILAILEHGKSGVTYMLGASDEVANVDIALAIGRYFGIDEKKTISFIGDRPGHDRRYAIDWTETHESLGWVPTHKKLLDSIEELAIQYSPKAL